jgi:hypothetical protein
MLPYIRACRFGVEYPALYADASNISDEKSRQASYDSHADG